MDNNNLFMTWAGGQWIWAGGQSNQDIVKNAATKENKAPTVNRNAVASSKADGCLSNKSPPRDKAASKPKKTRKRRYVPLNEKAEPIGVRVGRGGEVVEIPHCVRGKFKLDLDEPIVLLDDCPDKVMAERFLSGFGRFVL